MAAAPPGASRPAGTLATRARRPAPKGHPRRPSDPALGISPRGRPWVRIERTPNTRWRARDRALSGRSRSKTFDRKPDAARFLERVGADLQRGGTDPAPGPVDEQLLGHSAISVTLEPLRPPVPVPGAAPHRRPRRPVTLRPSFPDLEFRDTIMTHRIIHLLRPQARCHRCRHPPRRRTSTRGRRYR